MSERGPDAPDDPEVTDATAAPPRDAVTPVEVVGGVLGLAALAVADAATGGVIGLLGAIPGKAPRREPFPDDLPPPRGTAPVVTDGRGNAHCTGCGAVVAWAAMELDEHGYFCARCAAARRAATGSRSALRAT